MSLVCWWISAASFRLCCALQANTPRFFFCVCRFSHNFASLFETFNPTSGAVVPLRFAASHTMSDDTGETEEVRNCWTEDETTIKFVPLLLLLLLLLLLNPVWLNSVAYRGSRRPSTTRWVSCVRRSERSGGLRSAGRASLPSPRLRCDSAVGGKRLIIGIAMWHVVFLYLLQKFCFAAKFLSRKSDFIFALYVYFTQAVTTQERFYPLLQVCVV